MSKMQTKGYKQAKIARMQIVSEMVLRHYTVRQVRAEVMKRLDLKTYSTATVQSDIKTILEELREERLDNTEYALNLELERIDDTCRELWAQWEKSKEDYTRTQKKRKGVPQFGDEGGKAKTTSIETLESNVVGLGNVAYIADNSRNVASCSDFMLQRNAKSKRHIQISPVRNWKKNYVVLNY